MTPAAPSPALPGTRPEGSRDEREATARVREMFARIAPRYDFLNHLLSFSLDRVWRRRTARHFRDVLQEPGARVLDICCGTGDLAFALAELRRRGNSSGEAAREGPAAPVMGSDFVEPMLARAREKARAGQHAAVFAAADALRLPFPDASFDLITSAFGFRNLANYEQGLREIARVLRTGGQVGILEFSEPGTGLMAALFRFYLRRILPWIGAAISGDREAYAYLPSSVAKFPSASELTDLLERCGYGDIRVTAWNFGSVVLHSARRT